MRETRDIMGMPVTVEIVGGTQESLDAIFSYFSAVDARFSTYKLESEIMQINRGERGESEYSDDMREIIALAERTHKETNGFFSIQKPDGMVDPSGVVKGWAIRNAARMAEAMGYANYFIDAGGDIQSSGTDAHGNVWTVGIRNPFNRNEIVKVVKPRGRGIATSGTYIRGQHIYNPHAPGEEIRDLVSLSVIGPDVYEADRFATAAFAMGAEGISFIEQLQGFEGYAISPHGVATMTSGFEALTL